MIHKVMRACLAIIVLSLISQFSLSFGNEFESAPHQYLADNSSAKILSSGSVEPMDAVDSMSLPGPDKPSIRGPIRGEVNRRIAFEAKADHPLDKNVRYNFQWSDGIYNNWYGPYPAGQWVSVEHVWKQCGQYLVRVKAMDPLGIQSDWSDPIKILIYSTPAIPSIDGDTSVYVNQLAQYRARSYDGCNNQISYTFVFSNGESHTTGYCSPGAIVTTTKRWSMEGTYRVKVQATNRQVIKSGWSRELVVHVRKRR